LNRERALCLGFVIVAHLFLVGCGSISGTLPPELGNTASGRFWAGAAKVDVTPIAGYPLAGHSLEAKIARGHWLRLKARAIYLEGHNGVRIAMVATDLWGMPAGMVDRVAELLGSNPEPCRLRRDALILEASHTHQSPGNYLSAPLYNTLAGPKPGFDQELFEFLAQRIGSAITQACGARQPATAHFSSAPLLGVTRNRSLEPFLKNPEHEEFLRQTTEFPEGPLTPDFATLSYHAIDPTLRVLTIRRAGDAAVISVAAFFAAHPTTLGNATEVYSSDFFGAAALLVEQRLQSLQAAPVVTAIFNGAEGDVAPNFTTLDRRDTVSLGRRLGEAILSRTNRNQSSNDRVDGDISGRSITIPFGGQCVRDYDGQDRCTAIEAVAGVSFIAGAEGFRSKQHHAGCVEGLRRPLHDPADPQSPKAIRLTKACEPFAFPIRWLIPTPIVTKLLPAPRDIPIGLYRIGPLALVTLPGEFTTMLGRKIVDTVKQTLQPTPHDVLTVGLANEYLFYFTTEPEYERQHYEGAATLYGRAAGTVYMEKLRQLARELERPPLHHSQRPPDPRPRDFHYSTGFTSAFSGLSSADAFEHPLARSLSNILLDLDSGAPITDQVLNTCWRQPVDQFRHSLGPPRLVVEHRSSAGVWSPLIEDGVTEDDDGMNLVYAVERLHEGMAYARAYWLRPGTDARENYRISILGGAGQQPELLPCPASSR
jgi:neutral ceramidase